ncbi:MAG: BadF/BadG/BcrA/BcrD ATPase family protein [Candidatus Gastranaerophilales bacterium]|nr:BadF/BadG/BcrA/BcrD ATPase family protein [Candidatus Gastranaerophilales bacterium]
MYKIIVDAGTSWSKVFELSSELLDNPNCILKDFFINKNDYVFKSANDEKFFGKIYLIPSIELNRQNILFDYATGHMVKNKLKNSQNFENEIISLAYGAKKILKNLDNAIIMDIGSRDTKWVKFKDNKYSDLDWNTNCGSATGATVEMLLKYYNVDANELEVQDKKFAVTCGVFGMEKIMDAVANGVDVKIAISQYINGIAYNAWNFAKRPEKIYLSGGFCKNECFINSLRKYCEVEILGRFVLLEGLY